MEDGQEIELLESKHKQDVVTKEWYRKIELWRSWGVAQDQQARDNLSGIHDPAAVAPLAMGMKDDPQTAARLLFVEGLAKIGNPMAVGVLAKSSVEDRVEEVRLSCLDQIEKLKNPEVVKYYIEQLKSKDNHIVNRAALALGRLKARAAIGPLIDALVTVHKVQDRDGTTRAASVRASLRGPSGSGASGGMGGGGLGVGGGGPRIVSMPVQNQAVLDALVLITGKNFVYNQTAWRAWYAQKKSEVVDPRRD